MYIDLFYYSCSLLMFCVKCSNPSRRWNVFNYCVLENNSICRLEHIGFISAFYVVVEGEANGHSAAVMRRPE